MSTRAASQSQTVGGDGADAAATAPDGRRCPWPPQPVARGALEHILGSRAGDAAAMPVTTAAVPDTHGDLPRRRARNPDRDAQLARICSPPVDDDLLQSLQPSPPAAAAPPAAKKCIHSCSAWSVPRSCSSAAKWAQWPQATARRRGSAPAGAARRQMRRVPFMVPLVRFFSSGLGVACSRLLALWRAQCLCNAAPARAAAPLPSSPGQSHAGASSACDCPGRMSIGGSKRSTSSVSAGAWGSPRRTSTGMDRRATLDLGSVGVGAQPPPRGEERDGLHFRRREWGRGLRVRPSAKDAGWVHTRSRAATVQS